VLDPVHLTKEEEFVLSQHFRKSQNSLIRDRAQAILAFNGLVSAFQLSIVIRRSEKTIREWIKAFHRERIATIFPKYQGDNAAKLTKDQKQQLAIVLSKPPSKYGIPASFWDISSLRTYVYAEFGVEYASNESYRLIFKLHRYSFHLPGAFDIHRNDKKVNKRIREIKKEIKPFLKDDNYLIFAADECRIVWEAVIRRLWLPKGQKSIIRVERKRQAQSFIGLLNLKTGEDLLYKLSWQKQDEIIPVLEQLVIRYPNKLICIIWDNARFHHGQKIKAKLSTTLKPIHLINLPPYAPDKNPQEHVWKYGKDQIANVQCHSLEEVVTKFSNTVMGRIYPYRF
jgi:transposase